VSETRSGICVFKNWMKRLILPSVLLMAAALAGGCVIYSFSPGGKSSVKTIYVPQFENKTIEVGLSGQMTDLVVDAFIRDGSIKIVEKDKAEAILFGVLSNYRREAYTYDEADNVTHYVVKVTFAVVLKDTEKNEDIWAETFFSEGIYDAATESEEDGQVSAADNLVVDIINRTTKSW
jgi:lipopolysaccharide assembly LptE-like protein